MIRIPSRLTLWSIGFLCAVATLGCSGDDASSGNEPDASDSSVDSPGARGSDSGTDSFSAADSMLDAVSGNDNTVTGNSSSDSWPGDSGDVDSSNFGADSIPEAAAGNDTSVTGDSGSESRSSDGSNVDSSVADGASNQDHTSGGRDAEAVDARDAGPAPGVDGGLEYDPFPCGRLAPGYEGRATLLDVGHSSPIYFVHQEGTLVVTRDQDDHWVLWQTVDRSRVDILSIWSGHPRGRSCRAFSSDVE